MVSSISSNSTTIYGMLSKVSNSISSSSSSSGNVEDSIDLRCFSSKQDMYTFCMCNKISSLEDFSYALNGTKGIDTKNIDYTKEYQEYMKSRGCSSEDELKALSTSGIYFTKNDLMGAAKTQMQSIAGSLNCSSQIPISDDEISSILSGASLSNIATYVNSSGETINDSVAKFQTLLKNVCNQDNVSDSLKSSLASLSNSISNASESIDKYSAKVEEENAKDYAQKKQYFASLIANYQG